MMGLLAGAAALPLAARAQQSGRPRVGYLGLGARGDRAVDAFRAGLRELGYVEGTNLNIDYRFASGDESRLAGMATELVDLRPDVIVTHATGVFAARRATATIPIVMGSFADPVTVGLAASLAHPGGTVTGSTFFLPELMAKRLELLKEAVPTVTRVGVLLIPDNPSTGPILRAMGATGERLGFGLHPIEIRRPADYEAAFSEWIDRQADGIVILEHPQFLTNAGPIAALAASHRLPSIGPVEVPANGGLIGYGVNFPDLFRRAGIFVDKILKGAKAGDIPIEQATVFRLVVNAKTAERLGINIAPSLLARADEVIE